MRSAIVIAGVAAAASLSCGASSAPAGREAGTETAVDRVLRPAPRGCKVTPLVREEVSPEYAPLLGGEPVWFGPYLRVEPQRSTFHILRDSPRKKLGWRVKFLWIVRRSHHTTVTVRGADARGRSLWFAHAGRYPTRVVRLAPTAADSVGTDFAEFPSYVYFPGAGCFVLEARWSDGSWRLAFAAGR